jgi:hypothetical protein
MVIWYILWPFGIFCGHLVYVFCGQMVYYFLFWYVEPRKIWQPCCGLTCIVREIVSSSQGSIYAQIGPYIWPERLRTNYSQELINRSRWRTCPASQNLGQISLLPLSKVVFQVIHLLISLPEIFQSLIKQFSAKAKLNFSGKVVGAVDKERC